MMVDIYVLLFLVNNFGRSLSLLLVMELYEQLACSRSLPCGALGRSVAWAAARDLRNEALSLDGL